MLRKLKIGFLPAVVMASFAFYGCTVKMEAKTPPEDPKPVAKPEPKPEPKPKKKVKLNLKALKKIGNEIELPQPVPFRSGSAELDMDAGADDVLDLVRDYMVTHPDVTLLRVEGHTDSDGDEASNLALSKARTASVVAWLVSHNIECKRLLPVGFGEERPLVPNDTAENKAKNRRVSFFDASIKGKPVNDDKGKAIPVDNGGKIALDPCNPAITK